MKLKKKVQIKKKKIQDKKEWKKIIEDQFDLTEDQIRRTLDLFLAKKGISDASYTMNFRVKVKFHYE